MVVSPRTSQFCFDEMHLQQGDQYSGGKVKGFDANGNLHIGIVRYMAIRLKTNVPYVVRSMLKVNMSVNG